MANRNLESELDLLRDDIDKLRTDLAALTGTLTASTREELEERVRRLREGAGHMYGEARRRVDEAPAALEKQVHDKPLTSLAVAFGVGFVIGKLFER